MWTTGLATMFAIVSVIWMHIGTVAAATTLDLIYGSLLVTHVGWIPMFLGWFSVTIQAIVAAGTIVTIVSIDSLDRLTDEE